MSILSKLKSKIGFFIYKLTFSPIDYWENRAKRFGELSVLNISLSEEEIQSLKDFQAKTIFPVLKKQLRGNEQTLLDFGCGHGRLSIELADLTKCNVTGADPIKHLLQLAPVNSKVTYKLINKNKIPVENDAFDIIWISFVLGGITAKKDLNQTVKELNRVAKRDGLLFLIENTSDKKDIISWKYYSKQFYINLFKNFNLVHLQDFSHANEQFSIFAGRNTNRS
ncbi:class I SAM-dependent methyltransferase [Mucilaginibacter sp. UYCu711]|uniref:class I SAM-dependent methyltransferase n=1 Tax=Mucilaginibacter sp. UYCu711 TaxID=3156339 RepID=UPI003D19DE7C